MNAFEKWAFMPAKWYEFWRPGSNIVGGLIFGTILSIIMIIIACK